MEMTTLARWYDQLANDCEDVRIVQLQVYALSYGGNAA